MSEPTIQNGKKGTRLSPRIFKVVIGGFLCVVLFILYGLIVHTKGISGRQQETDVTHLSSEDSVYSTLKNIPDSVPSANPKRANTAYSQPQSNDGNPKLAVANDSARENNYMRQLEARMAQIKLQALQEAMGSSLTLQTALVNISANNQAHQASQVSGRIEKGTANTEYDVANMQADKAQFLENSGKSTDTYLAQTTTPQKYKYEVKAGTIIPAVFQTGINSDLPGQIIAKIRRHVFDTTTGKDVLIPQGATLIGVYSSQVSYGQSRCLMVWNRIIYPDGENLNLEGMPGADLEGYSGIEDKVNNHYWRVFGGAILMSVFAAAAQVATTGFSNNTSVNANTNSNQASQIMAGALGMQMGQAGMAMIQKNMNIQPTLEIRPGSEFNVLVTRDIAFRKPYILKID